jgi:DNA end-binding protein Ku
MARGRAKKPKERRRTTPARAYWTGQIRLSLVSIPVDLYPATKSAAKIAFHQIHKPSGKRVRYEKVVPGIGPVESEDILKGFEYQKGNYVLLTDEELDQVKLDTKKTIEMTQFVDVCEIDPIYFERPYFVLPQDELAEDAFRVLRDALRKTRRIGLGQLAIRGREYVAAIKACGNGLLLETLRFADEIREAESFFKDIDPKPADKDALSLAEELIERKTAPFDATAFEDHYAAALRELVGRKVKTRGESLAVEREEARPQGTNVIDLMSALKRSLEKPARREAPAKRAAASRARRRKSA